MMTYRIYLREWRRLRSLTQKAVAEAAGCHVMTVSNVERGVWTNLTLETAARLAGSLGIDLPDLFRNPAGRRGEKVAGKAKRPARTRARG